MRRRIQIGADTVHQKARSMRWVNRFAAILLACLVIPVTQAQRADHYGPEVREFVIYDAPVIALTHVRVIDGTGAPARTGQTVLITDGRITAVGPSASINVPESATVLDRPKGTVYPGLVGMHDHVFDVPPRDDYAEWTWTPALYTAPRLFLSHGVTTIRTTGAVAFPSVLGLKRSIDAGQSPGPRMNVTSPYLTDAKAAASWQWGLHGPADARRVVKFFAEHGAGSFKVYQGITRAELAAVVDEAHKYDLTVAGHLCSVTYREAAAAGIDSIEHGFMFMTDFIPWKKPDVCPHSAPPPQDANHRRQPVTANSPEFKALVDFMVKKNVTLTSTIALTEMLANERPVNAEHLGYLSTDIRIKYLTRRAKGQPLLPGGFGGPAAVKRELAMEKAFVEAGGRMMLGPDPIGPDLIKGMSDLRGVELLVGGGFSPAQAFRIATRNGAEFLGMLDKIGTIEPGKLADLVLVKGDPTENIDAIENIQVVFKGGIGYDPAKMRQAVQGQVGLR